MIKNQTIWIYLANEFWAKSFGQDENLELALLQHAKKRCKQKVKLSIDFWSDRKIKVHSPRVVLNMRKAKLIKKIKLELPLFWQEIYEKELLNKADYFDINLIKNKQDSRLKIKIELSDYRNFYDHSKEFKLTIGN